MADYAGAVLQVVGAATGQVWLQVIGMAVSAYGASQQVIPGPKIGDFQQQTAQEGGPRPIVFGRSHPIAGNIIASGEPRIVVTRERQGKGGPKVESESAFRTYAVGFCEGEADLLQVWRNNTLVYDAENPGMAAENAEFLKYARWFRGDFQQMPSPDLETVLGAGNVHGHRGTAYLVLSDEDVTDQRGAWSQWKARVFRGAAKSYTTPPYPERMIEIANYRYAAVGASIKNTRKATAPQDESADYSYTATGASVREPLVWTDLQVEIADYSYAAVGVVIREPLVWTDPQDVRSDYSYSAVGGLVKPLLIPTPLQKEEADYSYTAVGAKVE